MSLARRKARSPRAWSGALCRSWAARLCCSPAGLVGICRASVDPAADEPTSGSLQPVVGIARALSQGGGQVIGDQLGDPHIHDPSGPAGHATGMNRVLHNRDPERRVAVRRFEWAAHLRRLASGSAATAWGGDASGDQRRARAGDHPCVSAPSPLRRPGRRTRAPAAKAPP